MFGIELTKPFALRMEVLETDDHLPAMRMETSIKIEQFQHSLIYQGQFWIECKSWSDFSSALHNFPSIPANLSDMSGYFTLSLERNANNKTVLLWKFSKDEIDKIGHAHAQFSSEIDLEELQSLREEFDNFPVWWEKSI